MQKSYLKFRVAATAPGCVLAVRLNDTVVWSGDPAVSQEIQHEFPDTDDTKYVLEFQLSGKRPEHTKIDEHGKILEDLLITVDAISLDGIDVQQLIYDHAEYHHDFNGTGDTVNEKFFGTMGCNGRVTLEFSTPIYVWLLENM